ncbi:MAG: aminomethyl-transferring glycine dehydrogenase [Chitinophagales bacterium]
MKINLNASEKFVNRHIGPNKEETQKILNVIGVDSIDQLIEETIPASIRLEGEWDLPESISEYEFLRETKEKAAKNQVFKSYIGMGYYNTFTPTVIQRNIFENPGWYTQYTPYQAEIAQGRLEALINYQTMVSELTALPIANASLLDEGTAAAEAMSMFFGQRNKRKTEAPKFFVAENCLPQTIEVLKSRARFLEIELVIDAVENVNPDETFFGALLQYPDQEGAIFNYNDWIAAAKEKGVYIVMATDLMSLTLLTAPGELGADVAVGNTQRFGVPMGFGGPHAAFFATTEDFKRLVPGRIIGVSIDANDNPAYRMALQTREQHIRREKATSNICTAQALLAIMAGMYAVFHGPEGLKKTALKIHGLARELERQLKALGLSQKNEAYFDTLKIKTSKGEQEKIQKTAVNNKVNFRYFQDGSIAIAIDETTLPVDIDQIVSVFSNALGNDSSDAKTANELEITLDWQNSLIRNSNYLTQPIFNNYHSESQLLRYIKSLENKDLSLTHSMIALGSCTMKLNATTQLIPVSWPEFAALHPFVPKDQALGYYEIIEELEKYLNTITGFDATSLQPNSGAQGEYAGLLIIRAFQESKGEGQRNIVLIPSSAHGTNPASAVMAGMKVVVVKCDENGNIDLDDLKVKAEKYTENLSALMITYPSTHGVFEEHVKEVCASIHENGGQVYMDGANMNAQVGLTNPSIIGADVCHLNLHKTFAIPHGGGGPGMGPICVKAHLAPFLPGHHLVKTGGEQAINAISSAPFSSASILLISYAYIKLLGKGGLKSATEYAILNANYIKSRLQDSYDILYTGKNNRVAHELIVDFRKLKKSAQIEVEDVAKRLVDYGFHAPTMSFPVPGTMMIEPTESEDLAELDRFCEAFLSIKGEIEAIITGEADLEDNVLKHAPHTCEVITANAWKHKYAREKAAYPLPFVRDKKFWTPVGRINNSHGDRNLICTCPDMEAYMEEHTS